MKRKAMTIRLHPFAHQVVKNAAETAGVPLSTYITEAAIMRSAYEAGAFAQAQYDPGRDGLQVQEGVVAAVHEWLCLQRFNAEP